MQPKWTEKMSGGSAEAERREFEKFAHTIMRVQLTTAKTASADGVPHPVDRAFHAKSTLAVDDAKLTFVDLPEDLSTDFAKSGASYPAVVRFSNAAGTGQPADEPHVRARAKGNQKLTSGDGRVGRPTHPGL